MDDLGGFVGLGHGERGEFLDYLFVGTASPFGVLTESGVAHDVGVDPAGMHVDGGHAGTAQLLTQRIGETADGEFRRAVCTLVGYAAQAERAGGVDDGSGVLLDENR